eukprot:1185056-Prorocentrum_minimum.AAC.7
MADVDTAAEPQVAPIEETPAPAPEGPIAAEDPAAEAEAPVEDGASSERLLQSNTHNITYIIAGSTWAWHPWATRIAAKRALGKRKLEEDVETEGEPQQKKSNCDGEVENGTDQPVMDAPAHAEGEAPVATPEEPVVESICQQVPCPPTMVGRVIGKGGETIKSLEVRNSPCTDQCTPLFSRAPSFRHFGIRIPGDLHIHDRYRDIWVCLVYVQAQHGARIQIDQETKQINITGSEQARSLKALTRP